MPSSVAASTAPSAPTASPIATLPVGPAPTGWTLPPYSGPPIARLFDGPCVRLASGEVHCSAEIVTDAMMPAPLRARREELAAKLVHVQALKDATHIWRVFEGGCASFPDGSFRCWGNNDDFVFGEMPRCPEQWVYTTDEDSAYRRRATCAQPTVVEGLRDVVSVRAFASAKQIEATRGPTLSILVRDGRHFILGYGERNYARDAPNDACSFTSLWRPPERVGPLTRCLRPALDAAPGRLREVVVRGAKRLGDVPRLCGLQEDGVVVCWGGHDQIVHGGVFDITDEPVFFRTENGLVGRLDAPPGGLYEALAERYFFFPPTKELVSGGGTDEEKPWVCGLTEAGEIVCALADRTPVIVPQLDAIVDLSGVTALRRDGAAYSFRPGKEGWTATPVEIERLSERGYRRNDGAARRNDL